MTGTVRKMRAMGLLWETISILSQALAKGKVQACHDGGLLIACEPHPISSRLSLFVVAPGVFLASTPFPHAARRRPRVNIFEKLFLFLDKTASS